MRQPASTRPPTVRRRGARFVAALLMGVWVIGGGFQVAHADTPGHDPADHLMNPVAWMQRVSGSGIYQHGDSPAPAQPEQPFLCHTDEVSQVGSLGGGGFAAGPGLVGFLLAQQSPVPGPPIATPAIDMNRPGADNLVFPDVPAEDLRAVTDNIICQCGCGLSVYACELSMPCDVSKEMKYQAATYLAQGMTPEQTLDQFAKDFGERVLAAPTKSGFNLTAWVLPFVGFGVGAVLVIWALLTWRKQQPVVEQTAAETDAEMLSRIEDDVRKGM